tara:strand:+ start:480 stop:1118 length:639 start_codon:yes stop_codon:yes gene_type:complete
MTTLTIMTGPQGSGNHLFSKALGQNKNIFVWPSLQEKYWEGHDLEPFAEYWKHPLKLNEFDWKQSNYFITSISCPYFDDGVETIPQYNEFIREAKKFADIQFLIIGRDRNIMKLQQERVRGKHTTPEFLSQIDSIIFNYKTIFASQEMLYLYELTYLQWLEKELGLYPLEITPDDIKLLDILSNDANEKYVSQTKSDLDKTIKLASSKRGAV